MAELFTADDYRDRFVSPVCACGHLVGDHVGAGCYSRKTTDPDPRGYCRCGLSHLAVVVASVDQLIREKVAAELDRVNGTAEDMIPLAPKGQKVPVYRVVRVETITNRAEEVRNG